MSDVIIIKSALREYHVEFVKGFVPHLKAELAAGGTPIIDAGVFRAFELRIRDALGGKDPILIEANEENKTLEKSAELVQALVARGVRRNERLVAVGGGVIQDIAGFTASILYRGVAWVFFPTTLLAQADSCIGSKTSLNLGGKKNLVGTFYPPSCIYLDTNFLESLPIDDIKSGIGEMMHFYLYAGSPCFEKLIGDYEKVLHERALLIPYIEESLSIKKSVIEKDEFDQGERNKFNYGHTFGHALESATGYAVNHGQAVTVGMDLANFLSWKLGLMFEETFRELHGKLRINFPDHNLGGVDLGAYLDALMKDKKNIGTNVGCILAEAAGKLLKKQVPEDGHLRNLISEYFSLSYGEHVVGKTGRRKE